MKTFFMFAPATWENFRCATLEVVRLIFKYIFMHVGIILSMRLKQNKLITKLIFWSDHIVFQRN